jgi:hypothetical protein
MLSGTPFSNRLTDGHAYIDLLPNEPFQSFKDILRIFANDHNYQHIDHLQPTVEARFVKYFLSWTYGNTNEELKLPGIVEETVYFFLDWDIEAQIANYVQRFVEKLMAAGASILDLGSPSDEPTNKDVMLLATRARMLAWLDDSLPTATEDQLTRAKNVTTRARMIFKAHVAEIQAEEAERQKAYRRGATDELTSDSSEDDPDELPTWAHLNSAYVHDLDRHLPRSPESAALFMRCYTEWSRDTNAVAQKSRIVQGLNQRGIELPPARSALQKGTQADLPRTHRDGAATPSGTSHEPLTLTTALSGNVAPPGEEAGTKQLSDFDQQDTREEAEPELKDDDQGALHDLTADVPTVMLADERNDDPVEEQKRQKAADRRSAFREELNARSLSKLLRPRIQAAIDTFQRIRENFPNDRIVIWSQSVQFLDVLAEALSRKETGGISAIRFDGDHDTTDRNLAIEEFQSASPDRPMLTSTGAGGAGINLAFANQVILCEVLWNHQDEMQVKDRCHRYPQAKKVYVYQLFAANSAVDSMMQLSKEKKWAVIEPIMKQLVRTKGTELRIPEIAKWFVPIDVLSREVTDDEEDKGTERGDESKVGAHRDVAMADG